MLGPKSDVDDGFARRRGQVRPNRRHSLAPQRRRPLDGAGMTRSAGRRSGTGPSRRCAPVRPPSGSLPANPAASRLLDRRVDHRHGIGHRFSLGIEHPAHNEHPARRGTLGGVVWPGRNLRPRSVGLPFGLVLACQGVSEIPRAGGHGGEEQQGRGDESQFVRRTWLGAPPGQGRPPRRRGGLSGRELESRLWS